MGGADTLLPSLRKLFISKQKRLVKRNRQFSSKPKEIKMVGCIPMFLRNEGLHPKVFTLRMISITKVNAKIYQRVFSSYVNSLEISVSSHCYQKKYFTQIR